MKNLIDTHALIWFLNGDDNLSTNAKKAIERKTAINFISIASLWEISIKMSLGKLLLKQPFSNLAQAIDNNGFQILPITFEDTLTLSNLPFYHKDPFDRMIISQGLTNNLSIISKDQYFQPYQVTLIW